EQDTYPYPLPTSDAFWRMYAEPVDAFIEAAMVFRTAVRQLNGSDAGERQLGLQTLNALLSPVGIAIGVTAGELRERRVPHSLLGMFAAMVLLDVTAGRRPLACIVCGTPFLSKVDRARYCSPPCRRNAQKRRK